MTIHTIRQATDCLRRRQPLPRRLNAAHHGFELVDNAVRHLAYLEQTETIPSREQTILYHAAQARAALARAPTFSPAVTPPLRLTFAAHDPTAVSGALVELADELVLALVESAHQAHDSADVAACRQAAIHACHLHAALDASVVVRIASQDPHCQLLSTRSCFDNDD